MYGGACRIKAAKYNLHLNRFSGKCFYELLSNEKAHYSSFDVSLSVIFVLTDGLRIQELIHKTNREIRGMIARIPLSAVNIFTGRKKMSFSSDSSVSSSATFTGG